MGKNGWREMAKNGNKILLSLVKIGKRRVYIRERDAGNFFQLNFGKMKPKFTTQIVKNKREKFPLIYFLGQESTTLNFLPLY